MNNKATNDEPTITLQEDLLLRPTKDMLLFEWKSTYDLHGTSALRQVCDGIDQAVAPQWLKVLKENGVCKNTCGGLQLEKTATQGTLRFIGFLAPNEEVLSSAGQKKLREAIERFIQKDRAIT